MEIVQDIHIVEADGQCKEVLYFIDQHRIGQPTQLISSNCDNGHSFQSSLEELSLYTPEYSDPLEYLFEPGPALMKSGQHTLYAKEYNLKKLAPMTHLYTSNNPISTDMGRSFEVIKTMAVKKKDVANALPQMKANISTRNFTMKPEALRKKLNLKDGGPFTLFGCTLQNDEKRLILCNHQPV